MTQIPLGKYKHYKGGEYKVLGVGRDSETLKELVVYKALYTSEEFGDNAVWVRPLSMFTEMVLLDGVKTPRFVYLGT